MSFEEMTAHVVAELTRRIEEASARVKELESPAAAWRGLASAEGDHTVSDAAKILARRGVKTGPESYTTGSTCWYFRHCGRWQAMQSAVNAGLVVERVTSYFDERTMSSQELDPPH